MTEENATTDIDNVGVVNGQEEPAATAPEKKAKIKHKPVAGKKTFSAPPEAFDATQNVREFDPKSIESFAMRLVKEGQNYPILVRPDMVIVDGHRRHAAIKFIRDNDLLSPKPEIEYYILPAEGDNESLDSLIRSITANSTIEPVRPSDIVYQIQALKAAKLPVAEIAEIYGKTNGWVSQMSGVGKLPEHILGLVDAGPEKGLTLGAAYELSKPPPDQVEEKLQGILDARDQEVKEAKAAGVKPGRAKKVNKEDVEGEKKPLTSKAVVAFLDGILDSQESEDKDEHPSQMLVDVCTILKRVISNKLTPRGAEKKLRELL